MVACEYGAWGCLVLLVLGSVLEPTTPLSPLPRTKPQNPGWIVWCGIAPGCAGQWLFLSFWVPMFGIEGWAGVRRAQEGELTLREAPNLLCCPASVPLSFPLPVLGSHLVYEVL